MNATNLFKKLLPLLWLRPESAIWYSHMLTLAQEKIKIFKTPSMEFGCMDGLNSFLLLGGEIETTYDIFSEAKLDNDCYREPTLKNDYFDTYDDQKKLTILKPPGSKIDFAIDWKESHIFKSRRLGLYKNLSLIDLKNPLLPIRDGLLETIWAPNLYWSTDVSKVIREFDRVMSPDGKLFTVLPDRSQLDHMIYRFAEKAPVSWLQMIDRGRYENVLNNARTLEEYSDLFLRNRFQIRNHEKFIPDIVSRVYDIGFRPMFSVFLDIHRVLNTYSASELQSWKENWCDEIMTLSKPFVNTDWYEETRTNYDWHFFELSKRC